MGGLFICRATFAARTSRTVIGRETTPYRLDGDGEHEKIAFYALCPRLPEGGYVKQALQPCGIRVVIHESFWTWHRPHHASHEGAFLLRHGDDDAEIHRRDANIGDGGSHRHLEVDELASLHRCDVFALGLLHRGCLQNVVTHASVGACGVCLYRCATSQILCSCRLQTSQH
ncbi:hypothetical protein HG531_007950 [Fusarium graminearum]|nr:hypothetical protein HG531_007950 [Fusarium graminearum]